MRKVIYKMTVSLDGYVEAPDGSIEWTSPSPELYQHHNDLESDIDLHLYGRRLYETMAVWEHLDENSPISAQGIEYAAIWKRKPKVVFSTTLQEVGSNSTLIRENAMQEVGRLKDQPGKYISVGGPGLAASLIRHGLVDEYWLYVTPIILGGGKRMFPDLNEPVKLKLMETRNFPGGVMLQRYGKS